MSSTDKHSRRRANRIAAVQYLYSHDINPPEILADGVRTFFDTREEPRDYYAFAEELVYGVIENLAEIDGKIREATQNWEFERVAKVDLAILRLAIHEMFHRLDIPPVVSINEAIEISKIFSNLDSKRFINGILDRVKEQLTRPLREASGQT